MSREIALVAIWVCGCTATMESPAISEDQAELAAAIERWERLDAENYSYDFERLCNCSTEAVAKVHIEVIDGGIEHLTFAEDVYFRYYLNGRDGKRLDHKKGSDVPEEFTEEFDDIVFMMGEMEAIVARNPPPYEYDAVFDSEIGIPCRVYVDMSGGAIDEEVEFVVSNFSFEPVRPSLEMGCAAGENDFAHLIPHRD